jgi:hypothetical protein
MSAGVATAKARDVQMRQQDEAAEQMHVDSGRDAAEGDEDLYTKLKTLQRQLEFLEIQVSSAARPAVVAAHGNVIMFHPCQAFQPTFRVKTEQELFGKDSWELGGLLCLFMPAAPCAIVFWWQKCACVMPVFWRRRRDCVLHTQEEYIKEEQKNLKNELLRASEEVRRIQVHCAARGGSGPQGVAGAVGGGASLQREALPAARRQTAQRSAELRGCW